MWVIVHSPFGKALQAIRDNETRASFVGISVRRYRWIAFVISGAFTGLAGILWVPLNGLTTPDVLYWPFSGEIVFMSVLGGFRTFWRSRGGLPIFGYPLTEEFTEQNPTDGNFYTVQYFERARFEWHPEHRGTPFEFQLGLLGTWALDRRGCAP